MKIKRNLTLCAAILLMAATVSTGDSCYRFCEMTCSGSGTWQGGTFYGSGATTCFCASGNFYTTCDSYIYTHCTIFLDTLGDFHHSSKAAFCSVGSYCL